MKDAIFSSQVGAVAVTGIFIRGYCPGDWGWKSPRGVAPVAGLGEICPSS